ncbi:MAG: class I SAM-dependent methyltransferase [Chloroflexi bacterium]|nr:class I SAM-dependent methyltransferase [Chloroflexota bacterium]
MSNADRNKLFDDWAATYDRAVFTPSDFPFAGYEQVLADIVRRADAGVDSLVLDLGTGTGNLAACFAARGCTVWGVDFSVEMLSQARIKLPQVQFVQSDLVDVWPNELNHQFDAVVSAYVLHEFDDATKVDLIQRIVRQYLKPDGRVLIGDIAFATAGAREQARQQLGDRWDEDEYYWAADEALDRLRQAGLAAEYTQISACGGVFVVQR